MKKDEWVNKSIEERRQWYIAEINQLLDVLENSDDSGAGSERLKTIKMRMAYDNTPSEERAIDSQESYYQAMYRAYKTLPNFDQDQADWPTALDEAKEIISELNT